MSVKNPIRFFMSPFCQGSKNDALEASGSFTKTFACRQEFEFLYSSFTNQNWLGSGRPKAKCWLWSHNCESKLLVSQIVTFLITTDVSGPATSGMFRSTGSWVSAATDGSYMPSNWLFSTDNATRMLEHIGNVVPRRFWNKPCTAAKKLHKHSSKIW